MALISRLTWNCAALDDLRSRVVYILAGSFAGGGAVRRSALPGNRWAFNSTARRAAWVLDRGGVRAAPGKGERTT